MNTISFCNARYRVHFISTTFILLTFFFPFLPSFFFSVFVSLFPSFFYLHDISLILLYKNSQFRNFIFTPKHSKFRGAPKGSQITSQDRRWSVQSSVYTYGNDVASKTSRCRIPAHDCHRALSDCFKNGTRVLAHRFRTSWSFFLLVTGQKTK